MAEIQNPWRTTYGVNEQPDVNVFDWSFQNNGTFQFGKLYPVFCKKLMPKASLEIDPTFSLHFMPMMFPVQTRMRAHLHFHRVRIRNLWTDYMDFYGDSKKNLEPPYIDFNNDSRFANILGECGLGDYLNIPNTVVGQFGLGQGIPIGTWDFQNRKFREFRSTPFSGNTVSGDYMTDSLFDVEKVADGDMYDQLVLNAPTESNLSGNSRVFMFFCQDINKENPVATYRWYYSSALYPESLPQRMSNLILFDNDATYYRDNQSALTIVSTTENYIEFKVDWTNHSLHPMVGIFFEPYDNSHGVYEEASPYNFNKDVCYAIVNVKDAATLESKVEHITRATSPYYDSQSSNKEHQLKLSAYPFRAYEAIYNAFYRNILNNPFILNGQPEYNKYNTTTEGGADTTDYHLYSRNWEDDFLTTALPSPQQGAPVLVGITTNEQGTYIAMQDEDGNSYRLVPKITEDGSGIEGLDVQEMSNRETIQQPRSMIDLATTGISITDLRNCNALQRWLEVNARKGLRFRDLIEGHFDCTVRFDELNMPEFLGGVSRDVSVQQINQMSAIDPNSGAFDDVLGSFAGQAGVYGSTDAKIRVFCDEPSFIIGILTIVPTANYSQLLPRHFLDRDILDEYFPQFSNISMQPIRYNEVCPVQAFGSDPKSLNTIFGYQRAWYQYLYSVDEVHGLFRTSLRNFLINRIFGEAPQLSPSFLEVDPEQCNDVFAVTETTDKILGQIYFKCTAKLPIPRAGIPQLKG